MHILQLYNDSLSSYVKKETITTQLNRLDIKQKTNTYDVVQAHNMVGLNRLMRSLPSLLKAVFKCEKYDNLFFKYPMQVTALL